MIPDYVKVEMDLLYPAAGQIKKGRRCELGEGGKELKSDRLLEMFFWALKGEELSVKELSERYGVSTRSITRNIGDIKVFLAEHRDIIGDAEMKYSTATHRYRLNIDSFLTNRELLGIAKILIGSRALKNDTLVEIIAKLKQHTSPDDREKMENLIRKEIYHYSPVYADCEDLLDNLWRITDCIENKRCITIGYYRMDRKKSSYKLKPVSVMFSEYYFYLIAYKYEDESTPCYFRLDRIVEITMHRENFHLERQQTIDEGMIRYKSQFMFPGKTRHVRFSFCGPSVQAVLDRIPTARIVERKEGKYILDAEVFGDGLKMYLLSQGAWVEVLAPHEFREEMKEEVQRMQGMYES